MLWRRTGARPAMVRIAGERLKARTTRVPGRKERAESREEATPPRPSPKSRLTACKGDSLGQSPRCRRPHWVSHAQLGPSSVTAMLCARIHTAVAGGTSSAWCRARGERHLKLSAQHLVTTAGSNFRAHDRGSGKRPYQRESCMCSCSLRRSARRMQMETWVHF